MGVKVCAQIDVFLYSERWKCRYSSAYVIRSVVYLTTGLQPLSKRVLYQVWSNVSSFHFQYPMFSSRSSSSCLRLLPLFPVTSILPSTFPSITCFRRQFLRTAYVAVGHMTKVGRPLGFWDARWRLSRKMTGTLWTQFCYTLASLHNNAWINIQTIQKFHSRFMSIDMKQWAMNTSSKSKVQLCSSQLNILTQWEIGTNKCSFFVSSEESHVWLIGKRQDGDCTPAV